MVKINIKINLNRCEGTLGKNSDKRLLRVPFKFLWLKL